MEQIWTRLKAWFRVNAPNYLENLQPGASKAQIQELEEFLGVKFPEDFKASYRIYNGEHTCGYGFMYGWDFLSIESIKEDWEWLKEVYDFKNAKDKGEKNLSSDFVSELDFDDISLWNPQLIPLARSCGADRDYLDLNPVNEEENIGQVVRIWPFESRRKIVAPSFKLWLQGYADDLESGRYLLFEDFD